VKTRLIGVRQGGHEKGKWVTKESTDLYKLDGFSGENERRVKIIFYP